jgi:CubicO group peptidase (beta-lactamase class C family)
MLPDYHRSNPGMPKAFAFLFFFISSFSLQAQDKYKALDRWLEDNSEKLGGRAVLVIYKNGKPVYSQATNNLTRRQKLAGRIIARRQDMDAQDLVGDYDGNTRQRIASCSKWLSAALVMTFIDEGKLSTSDTIGKYLPVMTAYGKGGITISQCLSHLTGIKQTGLGEEEIADGKEENRGGKLKQLKNTWTSMDAARDSIARLPMEGEPGKTFHYGNAGLQIAAAVIEKISGRSFETLFQERIARPLDMLHTSFGDKKVILAAGGAWSTANDYMQFLQMILDHGIYKGKRILSQKSISAMQVNYAKNARVVYSPANAGDWGYGYGEWVMRDGGPDGAVTSPGLFGSFPWLDYKNGYCAMLFTFNLKSKERSDLYRSLKDLVDTNLSN